MEKSLVAELQCGGNVSSVVALPWWLVATLSLADVDLDHTSSPTPPLPLACVNLIIISIVTMNISGAKTIAKNTVWVVLTIIYVSCKVTLAITISSSDDSN